MTKWPFLIEENFIYIFCPHYSFKSALDRRDGFVLVRHRRELDDKRGDSGISRIYLHHPLLNRLSEAIVNDEPVGLNYPLAVRRNEITV